MKWQDLNKILLGIITAGGVITLAILFSGLDELAGVTVTYHSPNQVCQECIAEIHVNSTYWEICFEHSSRDDIVFKKSSRGRRLWINLNKLVLTEPDIPTEIFVPTYGNKLRLMKDGDCIHRYSKATPSINKIFIKGSPNGEIIKWGVPFLNVDPVWVGYEYVYKNITVDVPIYEEIEDPKNKTGKIKVIKGYKTESYTESKSSGVTINGKNYMGHVNIDNTTLVEWYYPIGDRNLVEYGRCRDYEIQKGVCKETDVFTLV